MWGLGSIELDLNSFYSFAPQYLQCGPGPYSITASGKGEKRKGGHHSKWHNVKRYPTDSVPLIRLGLSHTATPGRESGKCSFYPGWPYLQLKCSAYRRGREWTHGRGDEKPLTQFSKKTINCINKGSILPFDEWKLQRHSEKAPEKHSNKQQYMRLLRNIYISVLKAPGRVFII